MSLVAANRARTRATSGSLAPGFSSGPPSGTLAHPPRAAASPYALAAARIMATLSAW